MAVHVLGVRHHGPGSARSVRRALTELQPDIVLIEGPPEAADVLPLALDAGMRPPVALLGYVPDEPRRAVTYPFARFSPEWQALQHGLSRGIPVRFIDLPLAHLLAREESAQTDTAGRDPLRLLAEAAGYSDSERWWDHLVEHRRDGTGQFAAVAEAMTEMRAAVPPVESEYEEQREAHMRQQIRTAEREGHATIAVICGAWHVPALATRGPAKKDADTLKGLPKTKVAMTWVPWTHGRLSYESGYGAGVASPGWYDHLFRHADMDASEVSIRWVVRVAALLRGQDLDASSAQAIDAVRLAEAMAALRGRPVPGLEELMEAIEATLLFGEPGPLRLIRAQLIVGEELGAVPESTPMVPLQRDLQAVQRKLRMPAETTQKVFDLDLRKPNDRERSLLLHRLQLLQIPWGYQERQQNQRGTFHEWWRVQWAPELEVAVIAAAIWGNTVERAANAFAVSKADSAKTLPELTALVRTALLAGLEEAIPTVLRRLQNEAALAPDLGHLLEALPPLAEVSRYGDVRQTDAALVGTAARSILARAAIGLPAACASLDDEAAATMRTRIEEAHRAVGLLEAPDEQAAWTAALRSVMVQQGVNGLVAGRCCRLLRDGGQLTPDETATRLHLALSTAEEPARAAEWLEGFLAGSGTLLLHDDALWSLLDDWVRTLPPEAFPALLPLLRRTFSTFAPAERRQLGERARVRGEGSGTVMTGTDGAILPFDKETADMVLPLAARLLGLGAGRPS